MIQFFLFIYGVIVNTVLPFLGGIIVLSLYVWADENC